MADVVDRALALWTAEPLSPPRALEAFRAVYTDPLTVNGVESGLQPLVGRARMLHTALPDLRHELLERVDAPGRTAIAFRLSGRHTGPLSTPLGDVPATGGVLEVLGLDILAVADDRVTGVWAVADWLGALHQAGRLALVDP